jgi:predicted short-subunit dehydrogenase-like oxidoreductase (DUF2520 family)
MTITIIGTGNVATVLAKKMFEANHSIQYIYGRNIEAAKHLANAVNARAINDLQLLSDECDIVLIATSDKAIASICKNVFFKRSILLHTAGSVSMEVLKDSAVNFGVLYPIQSLRKEMMSSVEIPFFIDGSNDFTICEVYKIASSISAKVEYANDIRRLNLHTAAVFACNFVNYMYVQSANFCEANNIDFSILQPLIEETATRLKTNHPKNVFTGPAVRKDEETINKHLQQLATNPAAQNLYKQISQMIMDN